MLLRKDFGTNPHGGEGYIVSACHDMSSWPKCSSNERKGYVYLYFHSAIHMGSGPDRGLITQSHPTSPHRRILLQIRPRPYPDDSNIRLCMQVGGVGKKCRRKDAIHHHCLLLWQSEKSVLHSATDSYTHTLTHPYL